MPNERQRQSICTEIARLLKEERLRQGLTMTAVAERAGISQQMVSYIERGMRNPTLDMLLRVADVLNIPLWPLIKQATEKPLTRGGGRSTRPNS